MEFFYNCSAFVYKILIFSVFDFFHLILRKILRRLICIMIYCTFPYIEQGQKFLEMSKAVYFQMKYWVQGSLIAASFERNLRKFSQNEILNDLNDFNEKETKSKSVKISKSTFISYKVIIKKGSPNKYFSRSNHISYIVLFYDWNLINAQAIFGNI